jgi:hypothetical protein
MIDHTAKLPVFKTTLYKFLVPYTSPSCIRYPVYLFQLTILSTTQSQPQLNTSDTGHNNRHKSHHRMCLLTWPSSLPSLPAAPTLLHYDLLHIRGTVIEINGRWSTS